MKTIEVEFYNKKVKGNELADGVIRRATRKGATSCLVRCNETGKWCYTSDERLEKLKQRYGSIEAVGTKYISREGKQKQKVDASTETVEKSDQE